MSRRLAYARLMIFILLRRLAYARLKVIRIGCGVFVSLDPIFIAETPPPLFEDGVVGASIEDGRMESWRTRRKLNSSAGG